MLLRTSNTGEYCWWTIYQRGCVQRKLQDMTVLSQQQISMAEASSSCEKNSSYRRCHLQVIPQQYADIHHHTYMTKSNFHHTIYYLYNDMLIKQYVPVKHTFVLILIILPVLSVVILIIYII